MEERNYWLGFSAFPAIGPARFRKILKEFKTAKAAWEAKRPEFSIEDYIKKLKEKEVWFVTLEDEEYPQLLKEIKNPPFVLYGKGDQSLLNCSIAAIAVVGTRKTTEYGREVTKLLTTDLVANGFTIVSGLALGVDAISHVTALENNGKTIAVLGCGVDCCNPAENQSIYNSILTSGNSPRGEAAGCIISEFPLGMKPAKWTFPARNRIIAGLSQGVLVTEGAEDSGSLITADYAFKFNRKVFAVPGPITSSMSKGPYALIQKGATLVTSSKDIISELGISNFKFPISNKPKITGTKEENIILEVLAQEALHFDEIARKTKFTSSKLGVILSLMEIKGMIKSLDGGMFGIAT